MRKQADIKAILICIQNYQISISCKIPKNQADLHFMIFDVAIHKATQETLLTINLLNSQNDISSENEKQQTQHVKIV